MTEQQEHLKNLLDQRKVISKELEEIRNITSQKRDLYLKIEGAIEYLTQIGVSLPESEEESQSEESQSEES